MTDFPTVRVAAIQATPVILDAEASVAKAVSLLEDAAAGGAELHVERPLDPDRVVAAIGQLAVILERDVPAGAVNEDELPSTPEVSLR